MSRVGEREGEKRTAVMGEKEQFTAHKFLRKKRGGNRRNASKMGCGVEPIYGRKKWGGKKKRNSEQNRYQLRIEVAKKTDHKT